MARRDQFAEVLLLVAREVVRREAAEVCCGDLTREQYQTLRTVNHGACPTMGWLSVQMGVDLSTMSRNVTLLERNGYVFRTRTPEDARIVQVRLRAKGRRVLATLNCRERDLIGSLYDRLPPDQRGDVLKALQDLRSCLATPTEDALRSRGRAVIDLGPESDVSAS